MEFQKSGQGLRKECAEGKPKGKERGRLDFCLEFYSAPSPSPFGVPFAKLEALMIHISKSKSKLLTNKNS